MFFRDFIVSNKSWQDTSELIIISSTEREAVPMRARVARSIFGDRQVLWFKDDVVMLV